MRHSDFKAKGTHKRLPLYLVLGEEVFLRDEVIQNFRHYLGGNALFFKEYQSLSNDFDLDKVWDDVYSQPLFEEWNLIIVRDADKIEKPRRKGIEESQEDGKKKLKTKTKAPSFIDLIEDYLTRISSEHQTTLVLEFSNAPSALEKLAEKFSSYVEKIECNEFSLHELENWLRDRTRNKYKKDIDSNAISQIIERIGEKNGVLGALDGELQNLAMYVESRPKITSEDVFALVKSTKKIYPFDFWEKILTGNKEEAYRLCYTAFNRGIFSQTGKLITREEDIARDLLTALQSKLNDFWVALVSKDWGTKSPYIQKLITKQAQHFSPESLSRIWSYALEMDIFSKLGRSPIMAIQNLMQYILDIRRS